MFKCYFKIFVFFSCIADFGFCFVANAEGGCMCRACVCVCVCVCVCQIVVFPYLCYCNLFVFVCFYILGKRVF